MPGTVQLDITRRIARVTLHNPGKLNAIVLAMWDALRDAFRLLQAMPAQEAPSAVIVCGADGHFAAGGDIAEFAGFRFDEARLRHFHEHTVASALRAMLDCDLPIWAQIDGTCLGGGLEIAACCDIRVCGTGSRFGAPIAKLGFPMAPTELVLLRRVFGASVLREMLLEARVYDAPSAWRCGLVHEVVADDAVADSVRRRCDRIADNLSPQAARLNKRTLRELDAGGSTDAERAMHFAYADSAEHREGVTAFIEKRAPRFRPQ
jgi:enoyl-CoA hydratase/carnithine racemase